MTREEAIKELSCIADEMPSMECKDWKEAIYMAIKALEQEPICETLTSGYVQEIKAECEDCVSRQAVLDQTYLWSKDEFLRVTNPFDYLRKRILSVPSVTPAEKQGPKYCDRNICMANEYNGIGCAECEVRIIGKPDRGRRE